jgi:hypothetical protein
MRRVMIFTLITIMGLLSFSLNSVSADTTEDAETTVYSDDGYTKYVLASTATEKSTVTSLKVAERFMAWEVLYLGSIDFYVDQSQAKSYEFTTSIEESFGFSAGIPGLGEASGELKVGFSFSLNQQYAITQGVKQTILISSSDDYGVYELQLVVPFAKTYIINSDWEVFEGEDVCTGWWLWKECHIGNWTSTGNYVGSEEMYLNHTDPNQIPRYRVFKTEDMVDPNPDPDPDPDPGQC